MWDLVFWISAVRLRKERRNTIISISLCVLWCWFCERSHHAQMHLHIQPLRARSVCVDSPVCPISSVCFVITVLTVFPWQCACNDTQTHMALGACFKNTRCLTHSRTHSIQIFTHTHTQTYIDWYYLYQVTPWWWHTPYALRVEQPDTSYGHTQVASHILLAGAVTLYQNNKKLF